MLQQKNTYVGIMAGGIGSRFWPQSRTAKPKQFIDILGIGMSLLQMTYQRSLQIAQRSNIFIITSAEYVSLVAEQLPNLPLENILAEPLRKNTAPCIAYFTQKIYQLNPDGVCLIAPSDHLILKESTFVNTVNDALIYAQNENALLTLGIVPSRPDTGYGYIQFHENQKSNIHKVKTFTEKPNVELAKAFVSSGEYYWNSGMFVWSLKSLMKAFDEHAQEMHQHFFSIKQHYNTPNEQKYLAKVYERCSNISIDYAIMEKASNVYMIGANIGWSDLGTWGSLYEHFTKDYWQNAVSGSEVVFYEAENNMVVSQNNKLTVIQGLSDYIIVDSPDVLMICHKSQEQKIKEITADLKSNNQEKFL